jgi:hypothetical protein
MSAQNFPDGSLQVAFAPSVVSAIQDRTLQRVFRDALFPRLLFRMEAIPELWPANLGSNQTFTRAGLIKPTTRPLTANTDPSPVGFEYEQWEATAQQWGNTIDTHMPTSYLSLASLYLRNMHQLGMHAGQSLNRIVRDKLFNAYVSGNSNVAATVGAGATFTVVNLNGFTKNFVTGRLQDVSVTNPLVITVGTGAGKQTLNVTAYSPTIAGDLIHGGTLTVSPNHTGVTARDPVVASTGAKLVYNGGGTSIDSMTASSQYRLADIRQAVSNLRFNNVPPQEDGTYHVHLDPVSENQIFGDNEFQRLNQSIPDYVHYRRMAVASLLGCTFYRNSESPTTATVDDTPATGFTTGFELLNNSSIPIHRPIMTGAGAIEEKYLDESRYISDAGIQGKIGEFAVVNGGVQVMTERIRLILRSPQDRLQQLTSSSWSFSGDFPIPTDALAKSTPAWFKRAVVMVHGE